MNRPCTTLLRIVVVWPSNQILATISLDWLRKVTEEKGETSRRAASSPWYANLPMTRASLTSSALVAHNHMHQSPQYRNGFTVDDGPYRRLDDPANADFLRALASGRTPAELATGNIQVGLVDKRGEDYVEKFESFSGAGASLGTTTDDHPEGAVFSPDTAPSAPPTEGEPTFRIAVRLLSGRRHVVKLPSSATVAQLASQIPDMSTPFRLTAGFPPAPLTNAGATLAEAKLNGAQISVVKA